MKTLVCMIMLFMVSCTVTRYGVTVHVPVGEEIVDVFVPVPNPVQDITRPLDIAESVLNLTASVLGCVHDEELNTPECIRRCKESKWPYCPAQVNSNLSKCKPDKSGWKPYWCPANVEEFRLKFRPAIEAGV